MTRFSTLLNRGVAMLMLGSLFVLAGCHRANVKDEAQMAQAQRQFDMTVKAYKSGQFLIDGAVLSALDAGSHFAYLKDTGKLPKTVLLLPSDDSKVRKQHLQYMARLELDYGFVAYYDNGGQLTRLSPLETKARALEDYHAPNKTSTDEKSKDAAGKNYGDQGDDSSDGSQGIQGGQGQPQQH